MLVARYVLITFIFRPLSIWLIEANTEDLIKAKSTDLKKMCKYLWHGFAYLVMWMWALYLYIPMPWAFDVDENWLGYPHAPEGKLIFKGILMTEAAWYLHGFIESAIHDRTRKDFIMIMLHHVLAVGLIVGAFWGNAHRVAMTVVVEQDLSDIVVYASKLCHHSTAIVFCQKKWVQTVLLFAIAGSWVCTRVIFLSTLVYTGWNYGLGYAEAVDHTSKINIGAVMPGHDNFDGLSFYLLVQLSAMLLLQVIWFLGIMHMLISQLLSGSFHDMWYDSDKAKAGANAAHKGIASAKETSAGATEEVVTKASRPTSPKRTKSMSKKIE